MTLGAPEQHYYCNIWQKKDPSRCSRHWRALPHTQTPEDLSVKKATPPASRTMTDTAACQCDPTPKDMETTPPATMSSPILGVQCRHPCCIPSGERVIKFNPRIPTRITWDILLSPALAWPLQTRYLLVATFEKNTLETIEIGTNSTAAPTVPAITRLDQGVIRNSGKVYHHGSYQLPAPMLRRPPWKTSCTWTPKQSPSRSSTVLMAQRSPWQLADT